MIFNCHDFLSKSGFTTTLPDTDSNSVKSKQHGCLSLTGEVH